MRTDASPHTIMHDRCAPRRARRSAKIVSTMGRSVKRALVVVFVAFVVCGCGTSIKALPQVQGTVQKTRAAPWVRYQLSLSRARLFGPSIASVAGRGAYDFQTGLGYAILGLQRHNGSAQQLSVEVNPTTLLLLPSPAPRGLLPSGFEWVSVNLTPKAGTVAAQAEGLAPELPLDEVRWGARTATALGTHVVERVPMTEYRVTVDLAKALAAARRSRLPAVASAIAAERAAAPSGRLQLEIWVNGPGYVGRIDTPVPGAGTVSLVFTSYRLRYTGTQPPLSQTLPFAAVAHRSGSVWETVAGS